MSKEEHKPMPLELCIERTFEGWRLYYEWLEKAEKECKCELCGGRLIGQQEIESGVCGDCVDDFPYYHGEDL